MTPHDKDALLRDVFAEDLPADFNAALLAGTLHAARSKRRNRRLRNTVGALALVSLAATLTWNLRSQPRQLAEAPVIPPMHCPVIASQALPPTALVTSRAFPHMVTIGSQTFVTVISTAAESPLFRTIDDAQLLALAGPRPALLVRVGPSEQALIFPDEAPTAPRE